MHILKSILLISIVLLASIGIGVVLPFSLDVASIILILHFVLILITITANIVFSVKLNKKLGPKNFKQLFEETRELSEKDIINYEVSVAHLNRIFKYATIYLGFVVYLNVAVISLLIRIMVLSGETLIPFILLFVFSLISILYGIFKTKKREYGLPLNPKEYPILYEILENVKLDLNIKTPIHLYTANNNNIVVHYGNGAHHIAIGILPLQMLNRDELSSILYHEFGHLIHRDSVLLSKRLSFIESLEVSAGLDSTFLIGQLFISSLFKYLTFEFHLHDAVASKTQEHRSDDLVLSKGMNEAYISAGIKLFYFNQFIEGLNIQSTSYANEQPTNTLYEDIFDEFVNNLDKNILKYQKYIELEIEPKRASHPVLRSRMEKFGIKDYKTSPFERYDIAEVKKILDAIQKLTPAEINQYHEARNYFYTLSITDIKNYEENPTEDEINLMKYAHALLNVRRVDDAYLVYSKTADLFPKCAPAIFYRGFIKLRQYDDASGIEDIHQAARLSRDFVGSIEEVAKFSLKMGLQEERDRSREMFLELTQESIDVDYANLIVITSKTKLHPTTITEKIV